MEPLFFSTPEDFRKWLAANHNISKEQWIGYYKKATGKASITWPESVDQALCFGWIDGLRKKIDEERYMIRFTPRKPRSHWSAVNVKRVEELKKQELMQPSGLAAFAKKEKNKTAQTGYEQKKVVLSESYAQQITANSKAWEYYQQLRPYTRKTTDWWVMSAKREETRKRRLNTLIECCERGEKIPQFNVGKK